MSNIKETIQFESANDEDKLKQALEKTRATLSDSPKIVEAEITEINAAMNRAATFAKAKDPKVNRRWLVKAEWAKWIGEYLQIERQITEIKRNAEDERAAIETAVKNKKKTEAEGKAATDIVNAEESTALKDPNAQKEKMSARWTELFGDLKGLSRIEAKTLVNAINAELEGIDPSIDTSMITDPLDKTKKYITTINPFGAFLRGVGDVHKAKKELDAAKEKEIAAKDAERADPGNESLKAKSLAATAAKKAAEVEVGEAKKRRSDAEPATAKDITGAANAAIGLAKTFGVEGPAVEGVMSSLSAFGEINFSNPMSIITGGLKAVSALIGGIFGQMDAKKEKGIVNLQGQIDDLQESYDALDGAIDASYSSAKSNTIEESNKKLLEQNKLIEDQKALEESKKKTDDSKIAGYNKAIEENNKKIEENKVAARDAIFGADLKSAIENFATAYANAWAKGEDRSKSAKETVRQMMRQMVTESIKAAIQSSEAMANIRKKLEEFYADGELSKTEQDHMYGMGESLQKELDTKFGWADSLMKDDESENGREATKKGIATASQESVDENNGRLTAIQGHTFELNENIKALLPNISSMKDSIVFIRDNAAQQLEALLGIRNNTAPILDMRLEMSSMRADINSIVIHGVKIR